MRNVMTRVFPLPAPARINTGPSVVSTASRCCGFNSSRNDKREWLQGSLHLNSTRWRDGRPSLHRPLIRHNHMYAAITAFERESWYDTSMQRHYDYRRKLPHLQPDNKIFFITFSTSKRWMLPNLARDIVMETCLRGDGHRFELHALVVMPDHVHLALTPRWD